jgi:peptide/nickel transport system substrate-binding protein
MKKFSRRQLLRGAGALASSALLAACATPTPQIIKETVVVEKVVKETVPVEKTVKETVVVEKVATQVVEKVVTATPAPPTPVPPTPSPKVGGAVIIPIAADPPGIDPCNPWHLGAGLQGVHIPPYDPWFIYDREVKRVGYVAQSVTRPQPDTLIFEIRPGVKFHSGREFTAEDAVWSYERYINPELACAGGQDVVSKQIKSMKALDKYKLEVQIQNPKLWTELIWLPPIIDREVVEKYPKGKILLQAEAGTGPWILDKWEPQSYISYKRNPNYWNKPPLIEELRFVVMPDQQAQIAAMKTGQINFLGFDDYKVYDQLKDDPNIKIHSFLTGGYYRINVNHLRPALQDKNVLLALRHGINRQQMIDVITRGQGVISGPVTPLSKGYVLPQEEVERLQKYDPELAKDYLRKAGYDPDNKDKRLKLIGISIAGYQTFNDLMLIAQSNLKDIGVDMELRILEVGVWVKARLETKDYDLSANNLGAAQVDPNLSLYRSDRDEQKWTGGGDPELDKLLDAFNEEPDREKRKQISQQIQRRLIENVREIYLFATPTFQAVSKKLIGYEPWPGEPGTIRALDWEQVYWAG